jgi:hypothetical protein
MLGEDLTVLLFVATIGATVWLQLRQRTRDERSGPPGTGPQVRMSSLLGLFLPLVALPAALQQYLEERWDGYLVLVGAAALALLVGLLSLRPGPGRR